MNKEKIEYYSHLTVTVIGTGFLGYIFLRYLFDLLVLEFDTFHLQYQRIILLLRSIMEYIHNWTHSVVLLSVENH